MWFSLVLERVVNLKPLLQEVELFAVLFLILKVSPAIIQQWGQVVMIL